MNQQQSRYLELMCEVDAICRKHGIVYYLAGGTALGAVRCGGFLPWDDDVDLYITRDNLEKLEGIIDSELPQGRAFVSESRYEWYRNPIARYVDCTNTHIMLSQSFAEVPLGQHVEFLVMDPVPIAVPEKVRFEQLLRVYSELLSPYFAVNRQMSVPGSNFDASLLEQYRKQVKKKGLRPVLDSIAEEIFATPDDDASAEYYCLRWGIDILMYKREYFGEPRLVGFEGVPFPVASKAECVFRMAYGDTWMMIPDATEQVAHTATRNESIAYGDFVRDYRQFIDFDQARSDSLRYKEAKFELRRQEEGVVVQQLQFRASLCAAETEAGLTRASVDIEHLVEIQDWTSLEAYLGRYISVQLSPEMQKWKVVLPVQGATTSAAIRYLVSIGRYSDAGKILRVISAPGSLPDVLQDDASLVEEVRALSVAVYDNKDLGTAYSIAQAGAVAHPHVRDFQKWNLILDHSLDPVVKTRLLTDLMDRWGEDPELLKCLADVELELGYRRQAVTNYRAIEKVSRNGIVNRDVEAILEQLPEFQEIQ